MAEPSSMRVWCAICGRDLVEGRACECGAEVVVAYQEPPPPMGRITRVYRALVHLRVPQWLAFPLAQASQMRGPS